MDFDAFSAEDLTSPDFETVHMPCGPHWPFAIPVSHLSDKKWWYGFKQNEEVLVWHTVPYRPTFSTAYTHIYTCTHTYKPFSLSVDLGKTLSICSESSTFIAHHFRSVKYLFQPSSQVPTSAFWTSAMMTWWLKRSRDCSQPQNSHFFTTFLFRSSAQKTVNAEKIDGTRKTKSSICS